MRELRTCPVTGRVVLLNDAWVDTPAPPREEGPCWYCDTGGPVIRERDGVRAVPHPVPALGIEGDPRPTVLAGGVRRQAVGAHELVFGAHDGDDTPLLRLIADRFRDLRQDHRLRGFGATRRRSAGRHVAWQVFALPYEIPPSMPAGWRDSERGHGERVLEDAAATTLLAWAPRVPFETWVLPTHGLASFERCGADVIDAVAAAVDRALTMVTRALRDAPVDLVLVDGEPWRIELLPRLTGPAAVEVATGVPVHGVFPEAAAEFLRELDRRDAAV